MINFLLTTFIGVLFFFVIFGKETVPILSQYLIYVPSIAMLVANLLFLLLASVSSAYAIFLSTRLTIDEGS